MNRYFVSYKSMISCMSLIAMGVASCNVTLRPERLKLVDGEIDACLLVTPAELKTVTGFDTVADSRPFNPSGTSCEYRTADAKRALKIFVTTDETLTRDPDYRNDTAEDLYNRWRAEELKHPETWYTVEDIDGLGSQAYFSAKENFILTVHVLNNGIFYEFSGYSTNDVNRDQLIKIAKIALQRAP